MQVVGSPKEQVPSENVHVPRHLGSRECWVYATHEQTNLLLSNQKHKAVTLSPPQVVLCDIVLVPPSLKVSNTVSSACRFIGQTGSPVKGTKGKLYYAKKSLPYRKKSSGTHSFRWLPPRAVTTPFTYGVACPDLHVVLDTSYVPPHWSRL